MLKIVDNYGNYSIIKLEREIKLSQFKGAIVLAGFIKVKAKKLPTKALNMQINKEIFYEFKVKCKERGLPLNVVIEVFMRQYGNRRYHLDEENILKWRDNNGETETLNSTFNKEVYDRFKDVVKYDGFYIKHVISAFVEDYVKNDLIMEYTNNNRHKG